MSIGETFNPTYVKREPWMTLGNPDVPVISVENSLEFIKQTRQDSQWNFLREPANETQSSIRPKYILVTGASGSGKDACLAEIQKACNQLGIKTQHISIDSYYGPGGNSLMPHYYNNYDHPNSIDYELLKQQLHMLSNGHSIRIPEYDFSTHSRTNNFKIFTPTPIIFISGIMIGSLLEKDENELSLYAPINPFMTVYVDASIETCKNRRFLRDIDLRGRTPEMCEAQWNATVLQGYESFVVPIANQIKDRDPRFGKTFIVNNERPQEQDNIALEVDEILTEISLLK